MMMGIRNNHGKLCSRWATLARMYSSGEQLSDDIDLTRRICKIMMTCPALALDTALNQSGIKISTNIVEDVLNRFENAGMVAFRFFQWAEKQGSYSHSIKAYHTMIGSLAKIRQYQIMWDLVNAMRSKRIQNVETFCIIMRKYARAQKVEEAVYAFNVMNKYGIEPNILAFNGLLSALCKSKNVRKAQEIFDSMKDQYEPDPKTYSILLQGWGKAPNLPQARGIFREMINDGCTPDIVTYSIMVDILCKAGRVDEAVEIVNKMNSKSFTPTSFTYSVLIHTYGTENRIEDAVRTFSEMEKDGVTADVAVYNALISAFCKANKMKNVKRVMHEMENKGVKPNCRTFNIVLHNLIDRGETDEAFTVFRNMIKICDPDSDTYTMIVKMFCDKNQLKEARKVWKYMRSKKFVPSMHTYSVLINGLCKMGDALKASVILEEMIEKGIRPPSGTFGRLRQLLLKDGREDVLNFLQGKMNLLVQEPLCD